MSRSLSLKRTQLPGQMSRQGLKGVSGASFAGPSTALVPHPQESHPHLLLRMNIFSAILWLQRPSRPPIMAWPEILHQFWRCQWERLVKLSQHTNSVVDVRSKCCCKSLAFGHSISPILNVLLESQLHEFLVLSSFGCRISRLHLIPSRIRNLTSPHRLEWHRPW